jgi:Galactose mutarotase-like
MRSDRSLTLFCVLLAGCGVTRPQRESQSRPAELKFSLLTTTRGTAEDLVLDRFAFDGAFVGAKTLHVQTLSPGVHEVTTEAASIGDWEFAIRDLSNYYGFGERFDRLDHVHSILKNETRNTVGVKGNDTYKPVPFFMSLRGYGLWVDTFSDATFDLNVTDATRIRIGVRGKKLRFVLFEGPRFPKILERFTALAGRQELPPAVGLRTLESTRLPSQPAGSQRRHRPLPPAGIARVCRSDRQPLGDKL